MLLYRYPIHFAQFNNITKKQKMQTKKILIIGAGPAGLSAAIELKKQTGFDITILEQKAHIE